MAEVRHGGTRSRVLFAVFVALVATWLCGGAGVALAEQRTFASPEEAVNALVEALRNHDTEKLLAIFGPDGDELISSGDPVEDAAKREKFVKCFEEGHSLSREGDRVTIINGVKEWPFPIAVVKKDEVWFFDTAQGKEELLNRRIGRHELNAIQVTLAVVDAQREYAMRDRDNDGLLEYAQKFRSDPGEKNGLYWDAQEGEEQSPLGVLVAKARKEGYDKGYEDEETSPYYGYYYKILTGQGKNAPGGAWSYIVNGKMIGGFAVVASPAVYGNSGIMTFVTNHEGVVYQKDLGEETEEVVRAMTEFDPDETWTKVP